MTTKKISNKIEQKTSKTMSVSVVLSFVFVASMVSIGIPSNAFAQDPGVPPINPEENNTDNTAKLKQNADLAFAQNENIESDEEMDKNLQPGFDRSLEPNP